MNVWELTPEHLTDVRSAYSHCGRNRMFEAAGASRIRSYILWTRVKTRLHRYVPAYCNPTPTGTGRQKFLFATY